ncbi:hypothetical protein ABT026_12380 [Streptomyces sp. NPDC002734]|uniref:hypothetical protein n=1 Tax=Streptomyces sp. NPDC002734 TaxID=3154426 RepID=UPI003333A3FE
MVVGSLFVGAGSCGEDEADTPVADSLKGTELCGGKAVTAEASRALEVITGSSRFGTTGEKSTVAQAAAELVETWPYPTGGRDDVCRVYTASGEPDFALRITWGLEGGPPEGTPDPEFSKLAMGEQALAAPDAGFIQFACLTDRLPNATKASHVGIGVERWGMPVEPEGDLDALRDAYATVTHSVALAMAKELRCEKNGGLPERPVLEPA